MGLLYLCTFGLFFIGWFVDIIRYLMAAIKGERIQGNRPRHLSADDALPIVPSNEVGAHKASPIRDDVQERTDGVLSITNKRVIFSGNKGAFDIKISALSAITPYKNGIAFQFNDKQYPLETKEPEYVYEILARIINSSEEF